MTPEDRAAKYLEDIEEQRLNIVRAYIGMLSCHSKLTKNEEIVNVLTDEQKEDISLIESDIARLCKKMARSSSRWAKPGDEEIGCSRIARKREYYKKFGRASRDRTNNAGAGSLT